MEIFVRPRGGAVARPRPAGQSAEEEPAGEPESSPEAASEAATEKAILKNPKWEAAEVGFNEETSISVEAQVPENQAHRTKVEFQLFAKTPSGPEKISTCEGSIVEGKATGKIPVYIPEYKDDTGNLMSAVEYYFTAKHSLSDLLKDEGAVKLVEKTANRMLECHVLGDFIFASGKSQVQPSQLPALKSLVERIGAWKKSNPDGKLAVFGHADAVGQEEPNKKLSERRACAVHAFLVKDASAWKALSREEKWDEKALPDPQAFMDEHNLLSLTAKDFDVIDGKPHMGCCEFNLAEATTGGSEKNRRVAVFLLKSNRNFPIQYPCKQGDVGPCRKQKARKGDRRTPGFGCCFYDGLVQETAASGSSGQGKVLEVHYEDEAGKKVELTRAGKSIFLILKSENLVGKRIDIDLSDTDVDIVYQGKVLEPALLEGVEITDDLQKIAFIPRKRTDKSQAGGADA